MTTEQALDDSTGLHRNPRYISQLTRNTFAMVLAGGRGSRLQGLTDWRAKPAVPFGGKFRIIDFTLSNCVNSGVRRIGVATQYKSQSLIRHLHLAWSFLDGRMGEFIEIMPAQQQVDESFWYRGTADAVYQNLREINHAKTDYVLVTNAHRHGSWPTSQRYHPAERHTLMSIPSEIPVGDGLGKPWCQGVCQTGRSNGLAERSCGCVSRNSRRTAFEFIVICDLFSFFHAHSFAWQ